MRERAAHRLDHDFLHVGHRVDRDAEGMRADAHDDRQLLRLGDRLRRRVEMQKFGEAADGQHGLAQLQDLRPLHQLDSVLAAIEPDRLDHRMLRQGETLAAGLDDQRRGDGQGERNLSA